MQHKSFQLIEAKADGETGSFEALVSVFNNVDSVGDRILPGAFSKSLDRWRATGDPIPVILSHQWENPMAHVGVVHPDDAQEVTKGLWVKGQLDVSDNEVARQVHRLLKRRSLKEFSFGYTVPKGGQKRAKDGANEITQVDLIEVGPTLKGANPETELHAVKSALEDRKLEQKLQEVESRLARAEKALEDLGKKAEVTDRGSARSVDPLLEESMEVARRARLAGVPTHKPPTAEPEPPRESPDTRQLRAEYREVMMSTLRRSTGHAKHD